MFRSSKTVCELAVLIFAASGCAADDANPVASTGDTSTTDIGTDGPDGPDGTGGPDGTSGTSGTSSTAESGEVGETGDDPGIPACETELAGQLARLGVPGLAVGTIKNGRVACTSVIGMANIEEDRAVEVDTAFAWASVSKLATGTAVMALVEDGLLDLDSDINDYLDFSVRNPNCEGQPITTRQLLTHTSSVIDEEDTYDSLYTIGDSPLALGDFVEAYAVPGGEHYNANGNFAGPCPGERYEYSNIAVGLLGHLVAEIAGVPFDDFCRERIFAPLGMAQTSFHLENLDAAGVAMPYDGSQNFTAHGHVGFPTYPDGLLRTSVPHLGRFLAMVAGAGEYEGERILEEATVEEMLRVQSPQLDDTQGLLWYFDSYGSGDAAGHSGSDPGTSSLMFFEPSTRTGALLVANGDFFESSGGEDAADELLEALLAEAKQD